VGGELSLAQAYNSAFFRGSLKHDGHTIEHFRTIAEVNADRETLLKCDLIILDLLLPTDGDYPGLEFLKLLRASEVKIPVILLTHVLTTEVEEGIADLSVAEVLRKPCRPRDLKAAVDKLLSSSDNSGSEPESGTKSVSLQAG